MIDFNSKNKDSNFSIHSILLQVVDY